ncbi:hypothetical protein AB0C10_21505 [Microbispora amethystogenes]|uniref:hypothetical protein n=1 Tax=Microbispora amethystogenes TaxID=1427754 RepID=UPI0033E2A036
MTLTGTFVLAFTGDTLGALAQAAQLGTAALGLLLRYLTRPPRPGTARAELASTYGLSIGMLRQLNDELSAAGFLLQARRCVGRGRWQHLVVVVDTPGQLPPVHEAWVLLDAALAAEQANTSPDPADVPTCDDSAEPQAATCAEIPHIEPVNPFPSPADEDHKASVVATVGDLRRLAALPPLPAPTDQGDAWLTPAQVLGLMRQYPARYGDMALGVLARAGLPWYLAPRVMALMIAGYDTVQLGRALAGVQDGDHPAALARWRLDQLLLQPEPDHAAWRAPSTTLPAEPASDPATTIARGAAQARAAMAGKAPAGWVSRR